MDPTLPLVSVVCSTPGNDTLANFHGALFRVLRGLESGYRFEILYVGADDVAVDALAQLDPRIRRVSVGADDDGDRLLRAGLANALGDLMICMNAEAHAPELLPRMLDLAKGPCAFALGVAEKQTAPSLAQRWLSTSKTMALPRMLMLKRTALEAMRAPGIDQQSLSEALLAGDLPRAELTYVPTARAASASAAPWLGRVVADVHETWKRAPLGLITYFGAMVFVVGVILALWFSLQGVIAPNSVWFSWCYLIVLLHILGGSILYALGKVGTLATRILDHIAERRAPALPDAARLKDNPAFLPLTKSRDAA